MNAIASTVGSGNLPSSKPGLLGSMVSRMRGFAQQATVILGMTTAALPATAKMVESPYVSSGSTPNVVLLHESSPELAEFPDAPGDRVVLRFPGERRVSTVNQIEEISQYPSREVTGPMTVTQFLAWFGGDVDPEIGMYRLVDAHSGALVREPRDLKIGRTYLLASTEEAAIGLSERMLVGWPRHVWANSQKHAHRTSHKPAIHRIPEESINILEYTKDHRGKLPGPLRGEAVRQAIEVRFPHQDVARIRRMMARIDFHHVGPHELTIGIMNMETAARREFMRRIENARKSTDTERIEKKTRPEWIRSAVAAYVSNMDAMGELQMQAIFVQDAIENGQPQGRFVSDDEMRDFVQEVVTVAVNNPDLSERDISDMLAARDSRSDLNWAAPAAVNFIYRMSEFFGRRFPHDDALKLAIAFYNIGSNVHKIANDMRSSGRTFGEAMRVHGYHTRYVDGTMALLEQLNVWKKQAVQVAQSKGAVVARSEESGSKENRVVDLAATRAAQKEKAHNREPQWSIASDMTVPVASLNTPATLVGAKKEAILALIPGHKQSSVSDYLSQPAVQRAISTRVVSANDNVSTQVQNPPLPQMEATDGKTRRDRLRGELLAMNKKVLELSRMHNEVVDITAFSNSLKQHIVYRNSVILQLRDLNDNHFLAENKGELIAA